MPAPPTRRHPGLPAAAAAAAACHSDPRPPHPAILCARAHACMHAFMEQTNKQTNKCMHENACTACVRACVNCCLIELAFQNSWHPPKFTVLLHNCFESVRSLYCCHC